MTLPVLYNPAKNTQHGFSYTEILLSTILLAVLLVPAMETLNIAILGGSSRVVEKQLNLRNKMESVLSKPFGLLYAETYLAGGNTITSVSDAFSDAPSATNRRVVVLYRYDAVAAELSNNDTGLLYVSTYYENEGSASGLNTLIGMWW